MKLYGETRMDLSQGEYIEYRKTGELRIKAQCVDDENNGNFIDYYETSEINITALCVDDKYDGDYFEYEIDCTEKKTLSTW